ncbi:hypothetical protein BZA70DRAFT_271921 [Myxozyma melibiosi]|uniref:Serine/threonine-protein kinase MEC1 n=1 Tax=Myxozyma melibiosi TaxID=54550 RepID=A0ABR1FCW2_9ASCO
MTEDGEGSLSDSSRKRTYSNAFLVKPNSRTRAVEDLKSALPYCFDERGSFVSSCEKLKVHLRAQTAAIADRQEHLEVLQSLGFIPCMRSHELKRFTEFHCPICDCQNIGSGFGRTETWLEFYEVIGILLGLDDKSDETAIALLRIVRRYLYHYRPPPVRGNYSLDAVYTWIESKIKAGTREHRLIASRIVPLFIFDIESSRHIFNLLSFPDGNSSQLTESYVLAWAEIAKISEGEDLNVALIKLVSFLISDNEFYCALAYHELKSVAYARNVTPLQLLIPFMETISGFVFRPFRQAKAHILCSLLGVSLKELAEMAQEYILPYLVLERRKADVTEIAQIMQMPTSELCFSNLHLILATLFSQTSKDPLTEFRAHLADFSKKLAKLNYTKFVQVNSLIIAVEVLKMYSDSDDSKPAENVPAFRIVRMLADADAQSISSSSDNSNLDSFISKNILGIICHLSDILYKRPYWPDKRRYLRGMAAVIRLAGHHAVTAKPQICSSLQATISDENLQDVVISAWMNMLKYFHQDEGEKLLVLTLSVMFNNWNDFTERAKKCAVKLLEYILGTYRSRLRKMRVTELPVSIYVSQQLRPILRQFSELLLPCSDSATVLRDLSSRCQHENLAVVHEALLELRSTLLRKESPLQTLSPDLFSEVISTVIHDLTGVCHRFSGKYPRIATVAVECIGLVGSVGSTRISISDLPQDVVFVHNFDRESESIKLISLLLEKFLVPAFQSSTDTKSQLFLAFAMQQLLKICSFDAKALHSSKRLGLQSQTWSKFSEAAKVTLTPFLSSRYELGNRHGLDADADLSGFPLFRSATNHRDWVQNFAHSILSQAAILWRALNQDRITNTENMFYIFSKIIHHQDIRIAEFLLPFAYQFLLCNGSEAEAGAIQNELFVVLAAEPGENYAIKEDIRLSYQTVFSILDYCSRWLRARRRLNTQVSGEELSRSKRSTTIVAPDIVLGEDEFTKKIENMYRCIQVDTVATRALDSHSYARALFYYEQALREKKRTGEDIDPIYRKLQHIYSRLDDADAVQGISALLLSSSDLDQQLLEHESTGQWHLALDCYEVGLQTQPTAKVEMNLGLLKCLRELNNNGALLGRLESCVQDLEDQTAYGADLGVEASWMSSNWAALQKWVGKSRSNSFDCSVGKALLCVQEGDLIGLYKVLSQCRTNIASEIALSGVPAPKQSHEFLFKLHVLSDMEKILLWSINSQKDYSALTSHMSFRQNNFVGSYREKRYLLTLRQTISNLVRESFPKDEALAILLEKAKMARKAQKFDEAYSYVLRACSDFDSPLALIEHAQLQWNKGEQRQALSKLEGVLQPRTTPAEMSETNTASSSLADGLTVISTSGTNSVVRAKALLRYAKWFDRSNQGNWSVVLYKYKMVIAECSTLESGHYHHGRYCIKILDNQKVRDPKQQSAQYTSGHYHRLACRSYCKALKFGVKYVYQTLPKLLTLWLDFADEEARRRGDESQTRDRRSVLDNAKTLKVMTSAVQEVFSVLPRYVFFPVLSQILSRIRTVDSSALSILAKTLIEIGVTYPSQSWWQILTLEKSGNHRIERGAAISRELRVACDKKSPELSRSLVAAARLMDTMNVLCHEKPSKQEPRKLDINAIGGVDFAKLLPSELIVPVQANMTITWPSKFRCVPDDEHVAFAHKVTIADISPEVEVMSSLQMPKKVKMVGSDGRQYYLLCKPMDDLRKDARLMEFNNMINMLLAKDIESSKRGLGIMTYAVTVLRPDSGIIEWVENTRTLRDIIRRGYESKKIKINHGKLRDMLAEPNREKTFVDKILPMFPPVLYEWFIENYPVPTSWFDARTAFARTTAVMSIVGYILGLGDRHCDNILCHEDTGRALHVDFSCLFEKGLDLEVPECVPFRLTQNIVDALGPYGYDGPFRKCCEITLKILRENEEVLLPFLETFIHDPLVEWSSRKKSSSRALSSRNLAPSTPEEALERMKKRFRGSTADDSFPLSIDAQVDGLLKQATDVKNLSAMYIGWVAMW